jgi:hypothetical protein
MSTKKWFLSKNYPEDYNTVEIKSRKEDDPQGTRRFCADGTCPPAKVWVVDLFCGGTKVESDVLWNHHPPIDVVIHHLEEEDFKKLMCRKRGQEDEALGATGKPTYNPRGDFLGKNFRG